MIALNNVSITYEEKIVINNMTAQFKPSTITAIVGESGTGKTSLALALMGLSQGDVSGEIKVYDKPIGTFSEKALRRYRGIDAAMVFQSGQFVLNPALNILNQVMEPMIEHKTHSPKEAKQKAKALLLEVGINQSLYKKYPGQLSGGQLQKVQLAIALSNDPKLLILDEATAALDAVSRQEVMQLIKKVASGRVVLMISHDFSVVNALADDMLVLYRGCILEHGPKEEIYQNPKHPYTRGLFRSNPDMTTTKDLQGIKGNVEWKGKGCPFYNRCTQKCKRCLYEKPELVFRENRWISCHRGGIISAIDVACLNKNYGNDHVLKDVSLTLLEGETLAIVGESGSGKSTLAKCIMGLETQSTGDIYFEKKIQEKGKRSTEFHRQVQMIFQNPRSAVNNRLTVEEILMEPLRIQKMGSDSQRKAKVIEVLNNVQLPTEERFLKGKSEYLSGGELQRLVIARALMLEPKVLVADEPTSALDVSVQAKIMKLLLNLQEIYGLSLIMITHDIALARKISDKMLVLKDGKVVESGKAHQLISQPKAAYTSELVCAADLQII